MNRYKSSIKKLTSGTVIGILLIGVFFIPATAKEDTSKISDVEVTDISFKFMKVIATVTNKGNTDSDVTITLSVSKGKILPYVIGSHDVTIPAGKTIQVQQRFTGLGLYTFWAEDDNNNTYQITRGLWFLFFGLELG